MKSLFVGAAILAVLLWITGCGQRGPLYLPRVPADEPAPQVQPAQQPPANLQRP